MSNDKGFCHARWTDGQTAAQLAGQTKMTDYIDPFVTHMNQSIKLARQLHYSLWFYSSIKCAGHNQSHQLCLQFKSVTFPRHMALQSFCFSISNELGSYDVCLCTYGDFHANSVQQSGLKNTLCHWKQIMKKSKGDSCQTDIDFNYLFILWSKVHMTSIKKSLLQNLYYSEYVAAWSFCCCCPGVVSSLLCIVVSESYS